MKIKPIVLFLFLLSILGFPLRNSLAESYDFRFQVNTNSDKDDIAPGDHLCATEDGDCSLAAAIHEANALKQSALITIPEGTYPLNNAIISDSVIEIQGAGADRTIITGGGWRILRVWGFQTIVTLEGISLTGAFTSQGLHGAAINNSQSTLNIKSSKLYSNEADTVFDVYKINDQLMIDKSDDGTYGGAIYNDQGNINIEDAVIYANRSEIIINFENGLTEQDLNFDESMQLQNSISNSHIGRGGGIYSKDGNLIVKRSSFYENVAERYGGAIHMINGSAYFENVTFSTNYAFTQGDGIYLLQEGNNLAKLSVVSSTFNQNYIYNQKVYYLDMVYVEGNKNLIDIKLKNSLVYATCVADIKSLGYNLIVAADALCNITPQTGDLIGSFQNPILPLLDQFNDSVGIYNLLPDSPAIDAGNPSGCTDIDGNPLTTDQRGLPRPKVGEGICDIGAAEMGCGDGFVRNAEECDDGNSSNTDVCLNTCVLATCGDGFAREGVEACDDGNQQDGDGCSSTCNIEEGSGSTGSQSTSGSSTAGENNDSGAGGCSLAQGSSSSVILLSMFLILTMGFREISIRRIKSSSNRK